MGVQKLTLGPGLASTVEVVPAVDVSLTMLDGLWFRSCFDICGFGLWRDRGVQSVSARLRQEVESEIYSRLELVDKL